MVLNNFTRNNRASHTQNEYSKSCTITTTFSPYAFEKLFKEYMHYFTVSRNGRMYGSLSAGQFMGCFATKSRSISPDSVTQTRVFSVVKVSYWEKKFDEYSNVTCPK